MLWPARVTRPSSGTMAPAIRLKKVVLPAPLGPNSPTISPCSRCRSTLATACRPPKRLPRPSTSRVLMPVSLCNSSLGRPERSEEHTSELQSRGHLVCRLLLEKKNVRQHLRLALDIHTCLCY